MKKTLIFSLTLMALLNLWQFAESFAQKQQALKIPAWINTGSPTTATAGKLADAQAPAKPAPTPQPAAATARQRLSAAGLKPEHAELYLHVQAATGTPWQLLAAVHRVETGQRGSTSVTSYAGAQGPMQFMPATWRAYGADGDGNGTRTITDLEDSVLGAGRYLAANGASRGQYRNALWHYNHSDAYVNKVLGIARNLG